MQGFVYDSYRHLLDLLHEKLLSVHADQVASVLHSSEQLISAGCSQLLHFCCLLDNSLRYVGLPLTVLKGPF